MKVIFLAFVLLCAHGQSAGADERFKQQSVRKDGTVPRDGFVPKNGFVPDSDTAMAIAIAVLVPIYGRDAIERQRPFQAELIGGTRVVTGSLPKHLVGGVAEVDISRRTGAILRVGHGK